MPGEAHAKARTGGTAPTGDGPRFVRRAVATERRTRRRRRATTDPPRGCNVDASRCRRGLDHQVRLAGASEDEAALDLAQLDLLHGTPVDAATALQAGILRARHYHRRNRAVSLADCVLAAIARALDDTVATADPHLLDLCRDEHIPTHPLPDNSGAIWNP